MGPLEFFENENFDARAPKFWNWTSKIIPDLWLLDLFCPIKKKFLTSPYCRADGERLGKTTFFNMYYGGVLSVLRRIYILWRKVSEIKKIFEHLQYYISMNITDWKLAGKLQVSLKSSSLFCLRIYSYTVPK